MDRNIDRATAVVIALIVGVVVALGVFMSAGLKISTKVGSNKPTSVECVVENDGGSTIVRYTATLQVGKKTYDFHLLKDGSQTVQYSAVEVRSGPIFGYPKNISLSVPEAVENEFLRECAAGGPTT